MYKFKKLRKIINDTGLANIRTVYIFIKAQNSPELHIRKTEQRNVNILAKLDILNIVGKKVYSYKYK